MCQTCLPEAASSRHDCFGQRHRVRQYGHLALVAERLVEWHYIAPGKPQQNAFIESFIGKLRDEFLNETAFSSLTETRLVLAAWKHDYNSNRLHSSLGWLTPSEFANRNLQSKQRLLGVASQGSTPIAASTAQKGSTVVCTTCAVREGMFDEVA